MVWSLLFNNWKELYINLIITIISIIIKILLNRYGLGTYHSNGMLGITDDGSRAIVFTDSFISYGFVPCFINNI